MTKFLVILLVGLVFEAVGVVYLSGGLKEIGEVKQVNTSEIIRIIKLGATNKKILFGVLLETIFFGVLLYLLSQRDVSWVWPMTSLGFVITTVAAKMFLKEEVSPMRWAGVALIVLGAWLSSYSEKVKEEKSAPLPTEGAEFHGKP